MKPTALLANSPATCRLANKPLRHSSARRAQLKVVAFKEQDDIKDWRVKQMVDTCHVYYANVWSRGELAAADMLLDTKFVHRDMCSVASWGLQGGPPAASAAPVPATGMVVGPRAFKAMVEAVRQQYPDLYVEVEEVAVSDTHRIFVSWTSHGTQLEAPPPSAAAAATRDATRHSPLGSAASASAASPSAQHGTGAAANVTPSYHNSLVQGVDVITFNDDRSKILEVNAFRQLSSDERREVARRLAPNPLEIRLARLHWEQPEQQQQQQQQQQRGKRH